MSSQPGSLPRSVFPVTLKFEELVYSVKKNKKKEKTILSGVTGIVKPGEMLGLLGPSGSGKTTLLTALGGRLSSSAGKISYNGKSFTGAMRRRTGFVTQDDVLHPHLTVFETLLFAALLRLPSSLPRPAKEALVRRLLSELGLSRCAATIIGGPLLRGVSGGERKRVSIGQEMLINPSLVFLDEPTSGLDSTAAERTMRTIRGLAGEGRTIVMSIHQPSSRVYHMFDKVLVLSQGEEGRPIYYGEASAALDYFAGLGFPSAVAVNPADLMLDLTNGLAPESEAGGEKGEEKGDGGEEEEQKLVKTVLLSAYEKKIAPKLKADLRSAADPAAFPSIPAENRGKEQWSLSWWEQFRVLLSRSLRERRHELLNPLRISQVLSVAFFAGLLWWQTPPSHLQDRIALVFFFAVFWGFFPLYNSVFTFPQERPMLLKERSSGMYRLSSYFFARTAGDLPMELALPAAFVAILYWMGGLKPEPLAFLLSLLVLLLAVLVAQSLGLAVGALLMDVKQGTTLASVTTMAFLIAGGYYVEHIPPFISWFKYLSYSYYCYRLLLGVQFGEDDVYPCSEKGLCRVGDSPAIMAVGLHNLWLDVVIMIIMLVGYRLVAYLALRCRIQPR